MISATPLSSASGAGGCLCGAIRYRVTSPLRPVVACHCRQCQITSGNHVAATSAPREAVEVDGDVQWFQSSIEARRGFCATCGSNLFWDGGGDRISVMAGTLDQPTGLRLAGHIYCDTRGDWFELTDGLPQYSGSDDRALVDLP